MNRVRGAGVESRAGRRGSWIGVLGESLTVLLPGAERGRAADLWPLVDDGATLDEVLDHLVASGLSRVPEFVLVSTRADEVRVLVRGSAQVTAHSAEGLVRVRAADRLWREDAFTGIVALIASLPDEASDAGAATFDLQPGLCRVGEVRWGTVPEPIPAAPIPPHPVLAESIPAPSAPPHPSPQQAPPPRSFAPDESPAIPVRVIESVAVTPEPPAPEPPAPLPPVGLPPLPPAVETVEPAFSTPPAASPETEPLAAVPLAPAWQEEVTGVLPAVEPSGLTLLGFGDPSPAVDEFVTRPHESGQAVAVLVFSHGLSLPVDRPVVIGRSPSPRAESPGAELVTVPSPFQEISGNHVEIRPGEGLDLGAPVVTDLGSTNGTLLTQPGLAPQELRPGAQVSLVPGAVLDIGDGVTIQVTRP